MLRRTAILLPLLLLLFCGTNKGQQLPQYSQYLFNNFGVNPAVAGSKECVDGRLGYRTQWVGFEGAPRTLHANAHGRIERNVKGPSVGHHGIGGRVINDGTGPLSRTMIQLAYAYHIPIHRDLKLSAGIFAGVQQIRLNVNRVKLSDADDPLINDSRSVLLYPDLSPGVWLYNEELYAGLTVDQVVSNPLRGLGDDAGLIPHFSLTGGKKFEIGDGSYTFIPSTMIRFSPNTSPSVDLNLLLDYEGKVSAGLSYRNVDAIAAMLRVDLLKYFFFAYSFDMTTSKIRLNSANTHEVTLGFNICPGDGGGPMNETCPAYY